MVVTNNLESEAMRTSLPVKRMKQKAFECNTCKWWRKLEKLKSTSGKCCYALLAAATAATFHAIFGYMYFHLHSWTLTCTHTQNQK